MTFIPLDVPSATRLSAGEEKFFWPVPYEEYGFLSHGLIDAYMKIAAAQEENLRAAMTCKAADILAKIMHAAKLSLNFQYIRQSGLIPVCDPLESPLCHYIISDEEFSPGVFSPSEGKQVFDARLAVKKFLYGISLLGGSGAPFLAMNPNILMQEWVDGTNTKIKDLLVEFWIGRGAGKPCAAAMDISRSLMKALRDAYEFDSHILEKLTAAVDFAISRELQDALRDMDALEKSSLYKYAEGGIVSGTPKYAGRLIGWHLRRHGKKVLRHAHGGERVFYADYAWPVAELPYCGTYFTHSAAEAEAFRRRIAAGAHCPAPVPADIVFASRGSLKHRRMVQKAQKRPADGKTLVYVANIYQGEVAPHYPAFKLGDPQYLDWQIRLFKFLKENGWTVHLKPHPKGARYQLDALGPYTDKILSGAFDPHDTVADLLLFDFAGTSFFDSLFSAHRVALLNLNGRPLDPVERPALESRCSIIDCGFDAAGRVALDAAAILGAVESAPSGDHTDFQDRYSTGQGGL